VAEEETEETGGGLRSQLFKHEGQVAWINEQYGVDLDTMSAAEIIAYAYATRVAWRKSDEYKAVIAANEDRIAEEKAARAKEREEAKAEREKERAAKKAEKEAAAAKAAEEAEKGKTPAKATKATKTPAKASKSSKKATKATADSPFS